MQFAKLKEHQLLFLSFKIWLLRDIIISIIKNTVPPAIGTIYAGILLIIMPDIISAAGDAIFAALNPRLSTLPLYSSGMVFWRFIDSGISTNDIMIPIDAAAVI